MKMYELSLGLKKAERQAILKRLQAAGVMA